MSQPSLSHVATDLIQTYGNTARNVINAYRAGGERLGDLFEQRYVRALKASSSELAPEVRENALATQKMVSAYYAKGIALTTEGAAAVVDNVVKYSGMGVKQVAANAGKFGEKTGVTALHSLAQATVPAAVAVSELAARLEEKTAALAGKLGGTPAARTSAFKKARSRNA